MRKRVTQETFLARSKEKHGDRYDYSKAVFTRAIDDVTIVCPVHGDFNQQARLHYDRGYGCPDCAGNITKTTQQFITEAQVIHGSFYDYSLSNYTSAHNKVEIICPVHGLFTQRAKDHLLGRGCTKCGLEKCIGSYNEKTFNDNPELKNIQGVLYSIKLTSDVTGEEFWKIGITKNLSRRFTEIQHSYNVELIECISGNLYDLWVIEQNILNMSLRYTPTIKFGGHTECLIERAQLGGS